MGVIIFCNPNVKRSLQALTLVKHICGKSSCRGKLSLVIIIKTPHNHKVWFGQCYHNLPWFDKHWRPHMQKASMRMSTTDVNYVILIAEQKINRYLYTNVYISFYCAIYEIKQRYNHAKSWFKIWDIQS